MTDLFNPPPVPFVEGGGFRFGGVESEGSAAVPDPTPPPTTGGVEWPIRTAPEPERRVELNQTYPDEIRFYRAGPTGDFPDSQPVNDTDWSVRVAYEDNGALLIKPPQINYDIYGQYEPQHFIAFDDYWVDQAGMVQNPASPYDTDWLDAWFELTVTPDANSGGSAQMAMFGPSTADSEFIAQWDQGGTALDGNVFAAVKAAGVGGVDLTELRVRPNLLQYRTAPTHFGSFTSHGTARGCVTALVSSTGASPTTSQYLRQVGTTSVTFASGVGTITVPTTMGATRVPHAQVVGTTVGGSMVAQVSTTTTTIVCYLNTTFSGALTIAWSVEHDAAAWPATLEAEPPEVPTLPRRNRPHRRPRP